MRRVMAGLAALTLVMAGCSGGDDGADPQIDLGEVTLAGLVSFDQCDDFLDHVTTNALAVVGPWGLEGGMVGIDTMAIDVEESGADDMAMSAEAESSAPQAAAGDGGASREFSTTNVQEEGVDEPDLVKTDGRLIVAVTDNVLHIVDVTGPRPVRRSSLRVDDAWTSEMFLLEDRVLLLGHSDGGMDPRGVWSPVSVLVEVDISDPDAPEVARRMSLDGGYLSARMTDGVVRVVLQSGPTGLVWAYPEGGGLRAERTAQEKNEQVIKSSTVDNWLPYYVLEDGKGQTLAEGTLVECDRAYHPVEFSGLQMLNVVTIDLAGDGLAGDVGGTGVLADGQTVYASAESLYVGTTQWTDWRAIEEAMAADEDVDVDPVVTNVHKFDISDPRDSRYVASGQVVGTVLNQYSMSELNGHLRIATTSGGNWWEDEQSESYVSVLEQQDGELQVIGQVGGLGRGERIFAVRFLGDIATVVTFRQTDPLYTIDLSDPTAPEVVGELKILGYSAYLHPLGDDLLLGVGQDADEQGRTRGTQVSLFDISDLADPVRIDQWTLPGGWTEAEFNARAFLYWAPEDLVVLPVNVYPWSQFDDDGGSGESFFGAVALGVADRSVTERARITHSDGEDQEFCEEWEEETSKGTIETREYCWVEPDWQSQISRSVVVGDRLYTLSNRGLLATDLDTLTTGSLVEF